MLKVKNEPASSLFVPDRTIRTMALRVENTLWRVIFQISLGVFRVDGGMLGDLMVIWVVCEQVRSVLASIALEHVFLSSWEVPERARERHFTVKTRCEGRFPRFCWGCLGCKWRVC